MQIFCGKFKYKIENNMKVTKKDILSIKAGSSKVMQLDSYKDCVNARSYAYQLAFTDPREDVERYSISIDKDKNQITIEAIKKSIWMPNKLLYFSDGSCKPYTIEYMIFLTPKMARVSFLPNQLWENSWKENNPGRIWPSFRELTKRSLTYCIVWTNKDLKQGLLLI